MILRVGLTGGIASGKSTIARMLHDFGCVTVDADLVVADLYNPGKPGHTALVGAYGNDVLRPDGTIDRARLASIAFASSDEAQKLNALIHPLVVAEEASRMAEEERRAGDQGKIVVVEATLLLESGGRERFDKIIVVDVDRETQIARAVARGMSRDEVERRIAHQWTSEERKRLADYVIDNRGDRAHELDEVRRVLARLRIDLEAKRAK